MLGDALGFPRRNDDWLPTVIIGGVLSLLGFLILPAFIVQGYLLRVLERAVTGEERAPSFTGWGDLLVDGVKLFVVNIGWGILVGVPMFAAVVVLGGVAGVSLVGGDAPLQLVGGLVVVLLALVLFALVLLAAYLVPAAYANFAAEGSLGAAFDLGTIARAAATADYAAGWLLAGVVMLVGGLIGTVLSVVVVGLFVLFYVQIAVYYLIGRGYGAARGLR